MSRSSLFHFALITGFASTLALVPSCSSDGERESSLNQKIADVQLEGDATVAELETVVGTKAQDWAWAGGAFDTPDNQATVPADAPFQFTWHADTTSDVIAGAPDDSQQVYLLVFSSANDANLVRVFTSLPSYTPNIATWQKLTGAGAPITLRITTSTFEAGALTISGGPFAGETPVTFSIQ